MKNILKVTAGAAMVAGVSFTAPIVAGASASGGTAAPWTRGPWAGEVFVQTDNLAGNAVVVYQQSANGTLRLAGTYATEGLGGKLNGSVVDHLASEGSLVYDQTDGFLYAVNAGSNTFSVFSVEGKRLALRQVLPSGGQFPVSLAVRGSAVYVLNALGGGDVSGFQWARGRLAPVPGSTRQLDLTTPTNTTQFTHTPGQVAFSPGGTQLIVTTKAGGQSIDVFGVLPDGSLTPTATVNAEPGDVPFGLTFTPGGTPLVTNAGPDSVTSYALSRDGAMTPISSVATGQAATCWITSARGAFFLSNAGSATVSSVVQQPKGQLNLVATTDTDAGTVDSAATPGERFLYVQTGGAGIVDEFRIGTDGLVSEIGSVVVTGAVGGEGIAAS